MQTLHIEAQPVPEHWSEIKKMCPVLPDHWVLNAQHETYLAKRGISREDALYAGIFSADKDLAKSLVGLEEPGLIFTYFNAKSDKVLTYKNVEDAQVPFLRMRLDTPQGSKKFHSPGGSKPFAYFPRVQGHRWVEKGRYGGPPAHSSVKGKTILLTEGECKGLSATLAGYPTIALGGVWGWKVGKKDCPDVDQLIDGLRTFNWGEVKKLVLIFDSDVATKKEVELAAIRFGKCMIEEWQTLAEDKHLKTTGKPLAGLGPLMSMAKKVHYCLLPHSLVDKIDYKLGLDDFLVEFGNTADETLEVPPLKYLLSKSIQLTHVEVSNKGEIEMLSNYTGEPLKPGVKVKIAAGELEKYRAIMTYFSAKTLYRQIEGERMYRYDPATGLWSSIPSETWKNIALTVAQRHDWANISPRLMSACQAWAANKLIVKPEVFDRCDRIGFTNGVLILGGSDQGHGVLVPAGKEHYLTKRLGFAYDPKAVAPTFVDYMQTLTAGNSARSWAIRAALRWTLEPKKKNRKYGLEIWPILWGATGSGKGTLLDVLRALVGGNEYTGSFTIQSFAGRQCEQRLGNMANKQVSIASDLKGSFDEESIGILNQVISNEPVETKVKNLTYLSTALNTVLWAGMNKPPKFGSQDSIGLQRRLLIIPVKPPKKRDPYLLEKLLKELPGIYNWIMALPMATAQRHIEHYKNSQESRDTLKTQVLDSNSAMRWLVDHLEFFAGVEPEDKRTFISEHYEDYTDWCRDENTKPFGKRNFAKVLTAAGTQKMAKVQGYYKLALPTLKGINWEEVSNL